MEERLLAVLRRPQVLVGLVSRRRRPFNIDEAPPEPYVEVPLALSQVRETTCPWKDKDVKAWRALSNVPRLSERAMLAIIRSLIGSVSEPGADAELPPLDTNALPRDLRPHLCHADHEQQLVASIADVLLETSSKTDMPDWHWSRRRELVGLPAEFRRLFLWSLHLQPWDRVLEVLAAYDALALDDEPALRSGVARLLSFSGPEIMVAWSGLLKGLDQARRVRALELVLESAAREREPRESDADVLAGGDDAAALVTLAS